MKAQMCHNVVSSWFFVCYVHHTTERIKEEFLFCKSLLGTTKAVDVFEMIKSFFLKYEVDWKNTLGSLCTDAPAMLGNTSGFAALVKKEAPNIPITHCFLRRHALAPRTLPSFLKEVMSTYVKIVKIVPIENLGSDTSATKSLLFEYIPFRGLFCKPFLVL